MTRESTVSGGEAVRPGGSPKTWASEARRLSRQHAGAETWAEGLKRELSDADDDDLGTFIVAIAAFSALNHARQVEAARQEAVRAAEEARRQESQRVALAAQEAELAREREAKQRARAIAKHKQFRIVSYVALPAGAVVAFLGLPMLGLSVWPADYVTDKDISRLHWYLPIVVGSFMMSLVMTILSARVRGESYWPRVVAFFTFAVGLTTVVFWLLIIIGA